jgi:hypothetical protein
MPASPTITDARWRARNDYWIKSKGQAVQIYVAHRTVTGGKVAEDPPVLRGASWAMLQFGQDAKDAAAELGVNPNLVCIAYFHSSAAPYLTDRAYVQDVEAVWWLAEAQPQAQPFPGPIGLAVVLQRQLEGPF